VRERTDKLVRDVVLNDATPFVPLIVEKRGRDTSVDDWGGRREGAGRPRGSRNANVKARREASQQIVRQFQIDHPDAFTGDAVALMQCIYRDASLPLEIRLDAASKAARFERPALAATLTRDMTPMPATQAEANARIQALLMTGIAGHVAIDGSAIGATRRPPPSLRGRTGAVAGKALVARCRTIFGMTRSPISLLAGGSAGVINAAPLGLGILASAPQLPTSKPFGSPGDEPRSR
jgi:hypothetical protein